MPELLLKLSANLLRIRSMIIKFILDFGTVVVLLLKVEPSKRRSVNFDKPLRVALDALSGIKFLQSGLHLAKGEQFNVYLFTLQINVVKSEFNGKIRYGKSLDLV